MIYSTMSDYLIIYFLINIHLICNKSCQLYRFRTSLSAPSSETQCEKFEANSDLDGVKTAYHLVRQLKKKSAMLKKCVEILLPLTLPNEDNMTVNLKEESKPLLWRKELEPNPIGKITKNYIKFEKKIALATQETCEKVIPKKTYKVALYIIQQ
ncbi:hypothetical protein BpHYR1_029126 [Brachionus plicatilis]|uniref:Uncharacterized protein n=1 Tax=Brachionus plicatilis TaxID=10195 RepID=A0A3M7R417_BRAPC|nr:hypothetical protein BpHYR1_029126 [Brachionus plicatilis]